MSENVPAIKRHNHRLHPCSDDRKEALLAVLIERAGEAEVLVVAEAFPEGLAERFAETGAVFAADAELEALEKQRFASVISYDLPEEPQQYLARLAFAAEHASVLLDPGQRIRLYPVETLLGRTIREEAVEGFAPAETEGGKRKTGSGNRKSGHGKREAGSGKRKPGSGKPEYGKDGRKPAGGGKKPPKRIGIKVKGTRTETEK
jgi:hypothetical protein